MFTEEVFIRVVMEVIDPMQLFVGMLMVYLYVVIAKWPMKRQVWVSMILLLIASAGVEPDQPTGLRYIFLFIGFFALTLHYVYHEPTKED